MGTDTKRAVSVDVKRKVVEEGVLIGWALLHIIFLEVGSISNSRPTIKHWWIFTSSQRARRSTFNDA